MAPPSERQMKEFRNSWIIDRIFSYSINVAILVSIILIGSSLNRNVFKEADSIRGTFKNFFILYDNLNVDRIKLSDKKNEILYLENQDLKRRMEIIIAGVDEIGRKISENKPQVIVQQIPAAPPSKEAQEIKLDRFLPNVVRIVDFKRDEESKQLKESGSASGFVVHKDASNIIIMTAEHVIDHIKEGVDYYTAVKFPLGDNTPDQDYVWFERPFKVLKTSNKYDLALLQIPNSKEFEHLVPLKIASASKKFERIFRIGYPSYGDLFYAEGLICSYGTSDRLNYRIRKDGDRWPQRKVWIGSIQTFYGDSGAPLISKDTLSVIGVTVGKDPRYENYCIFVPHTVIQEWFSEIGFNPTGS